MLNSFHILFELFVVGGIGSELIYMFRLLQPWGRYRKVRANIRRLNAYGNLDSSKGHGNKGGRQQKAVCHYGLTEAGYQVLLGTLKKVEQKNAVLTSVIAFVMAAFLAVSFTPVDAEKGVEDWTGYGLFLVWIAAMLILPLCAAIFGMRQVDIHDSQLLLRRLPENVVQRGLERDLLLDLCCKEDAFRFAWRVVLLLIPTLLVAIVIDAA